MTNFSNCHFSSDRLYRYTLNRVWDTGLKSCMFLALNPSTADESKDDPTIRRCIGYAKSWGYGSLWVGNIFAYRATDPKDMKVCSEPVGDLNNGALIWMAKQSEVVVSSWGNHGSYLDRDKEVLKLFHSNSLSLHYLKMTKQNQPSHPLYLPKTLYPKSYNP